MPRALNRDEQATLALVRRAEVAIPVPELAVRLNLAIPVTQASCDYLMSRALLRASIYAADPPPGAKDDATASHSVRSATDQPRVP